MAACWSPRIAGDRHAGERARARGPSPYTSERRPDLRQHRQRDAHVLGDARVPGQGVQVHQHGAGGVGRVGDVQAAVDAAGHVPDHPGVHVAEHQVAGLGLLPGALDVVEDPARPSARRSRWPAAARPWPCTARRRRRGRRGLDRWRRCGCPARRSRCRPARRWCWSQTSAVSRWLVMPTAAMSSRSGRPWPARPPRPRGCCPRSRSRCARPSPPSGRSARVPSGRPTTTRPSRLKTMHRVDVVPWSIAATNFSLICVHPFRRCIGLR